MIRSVSNFSEASADLLSELFWQSSMRIAIIDDLCRIVLTSKAFRDAFAHQIRVEDGSELICFERRDGDKTFRVRLAGLPPGERLAINVKLPFAGVESRIQLEVSALHSHREARRLFLTEWIPEGNGESLSKAALEIEQNYRELQENLPVGVYRALSSGLIQTCNSALIRMMRYETFEELQKARLADVWVDPSQRERMIEKLREDGFVLGYQVRLRRADATELIASFDARGTFDGDGRLLYFDTIVQDITRRVEAKRELERLARTDSLTGLYNRQHLMAKLEAERVRAERYDRPLSVMLIDLDHFKQVNDGHGHLAGDAVLISAATVIRNTLRETDFVGRYGGEEFLVVLPETELKGALDLAERLRRAMADTGHMLPDGNVLEVTCSIGVAEAIFDEIEDIIDLADSAMYSAKRSGRNMVMRCRTTP